MITLKGLSVVRVFTLVTLLYAVLLLPACGRAGKSSGNSSSSSTLDVTGTLLAEVGGGSDLRGWTLALVDAGSGESRISELDSTGTFIFKKIDQSKEYTLVLFNSDYRLTAVLAMPSPLESDKVLQYFKVKEKKLPSVIFKGQTLVLSNTSAVKMLSYTADDSDGDGVPDGLDTSSSLVGDDFILAPSDKDAELPSFALARTADSDSDGILNGIDPDIDSDGLPNWFDDDNDNNGTLDIFDIDANADLTIDSAQKKGDNYFTDGVEFIVGQLYRTSDAALNLRFSVKVDPESRPNSVTLVGSSTLFDQSRILSRKSAGAEQAGNVWDYSLSDDGASYDDASNDGLYSRKIRLKSGKKLKSRQTNFIRLNYGTYTREFPYMFPAVNLADITFSYSSTNHRITKAGSPFGEEDSYLWTVSVYNKDGALVHTSAPIEAKTDTYDIPSEDLSDGEAYTAKIFAQSLEKVAGYPVIVIESEEADL